MRGGWCGKSGGFWEGRPRSESVSGSSSRNPPTSQHCIPAAQGSEHRPLGSLPLCLCGSDGPSSPAVSGTDPASSTNIPCCSHGELWISGEPSAAADRGKSEQATSPSERAQCAHPVRPVSRLLLPMTDLRFGLSRW